MKKLVAVLAVATLTVSAPVMAEVNTIGISDSTNNELAFAINDVQNLQATLMTDEQMAETQGAWLPYVGVGAVGGYFGYMGYVSAVPKNQRTFGGYATAIGSGAVGGALTLTPIGATRAAFGGFRWFCWQSSSYQH